MLRAGRVKVHTRPDAKGLLLDRVETTRHTEKMAKAVVAGARRHFLSMVKHTHPVTPPPYADSFFIHRDPNAPKGKHGMFMAGNNDPVALLVEFGSHPGGHDTFVKGYRPLGHGLDSAAGGR